MKKYSALLIVAFLTGIVIGIVVKEKVTYMSPMTIERMESTRSELETVQGQMRINEEIILQLKEEVAQWMVLTKEQSSLETLTGLRDMYKTLAGYEEMIGEGIKIELRDSQDPILGETNMGVIHDVDILTILNELRANDAEAISVNGVRVLGNSTIKCGGPIIRIDGISKATPYVIEAIGNKERLYAGVYERNGYVRLLEDVYKIQVSLEQKDEIRIPAKKE
ncbi:MAG: DUF881 domain-containing protein [Tissierellia bacterium]|nr:DUF881 domain-containing protein [Tissierellia bacterium]